MEQVFIPVILGTNREGRRSEHVAHFVIDEISKRDDIDTQLIDIKDFNFPQEGYGQDIKENFSEYRELIEKSDGLILVLPEYNHSFSGNVKTLLDILLPEYNHKAAGIVGVSVGPWGGTRVIESIQPVLRELGLVGLGTDLNFSEVAKQFNESGELQNDIYYELSDKFLSELVWMSKTLRWGRENISK